MFDVRKAVDNAASYEVGARDVTRIADAILPLIEAEIAEAVADTEARMREHYRPALAAWGQYALWSTGNRSGLARATPHEILADHDITGPLADEILAAGEAP